MNIVPPDKVFYTVTGERRLPFMGAVNGNERRKEEKMIYFVINPWLFYVGIILFFCCSIGIQLVVAHYLFKTEREARELEEGKAVILRECIKEYLKEEDSIKNLVLFTEKRLRELKVGKVSLICLKHASGQLLLFGIFLAGIGACIRIIEGKTLGEILPYYILSFLGLYFYFSLTGWIDYEERMKGIKENILDFIENKKYRGIYQDLKIEEVVGRQEALFFSGEEEKELRELLREILA